MPLFKNRTGFQSTWSPMIDRDGRNVAVVIVKATYEIEGAALVPAAVHEPILMVDEYMGAPAVSDMYAPSDLVDFKPAGEVVIVRPRDQARQRRLQDQTVSVEVGSLRIRKSVGKTWPFGPLRRDQEPRRSRAGTFDNAWALDRMPLLPTDFNPAHNLSAPPDQVASGYFAGDEAVRIANLHEPGAQVATRLPGQCVAVSGNVMHRYFTELAVLDTLLVWSDRPAVTLVWRYVIQAPTKIEEVRNIYVDPLRLTVARQLYVK